MSRSLVIDSREMLMFNPRYESIITRLICLGNVIVVSSAVRRGAYWHLLEACLHSSQYTTHTENVLSAAASRLGLSSFSQLFESYASQIAYSIRQDQQDFLRLPAHLLGYKDRRECAEHTFHAFTPTNILANGPPNIVEHGRRLFLSHCAAIQKVPSEGIRDCFSEIIGYQIVWWIGEDGLLGDSLGDELEQLLRTRAKEVGEGEDYDTLMRQHADGVIATILSTLMDQDFTRDGPIVTSLDVLGSGEPVIRAFRAMSRYRKLDDFIFHQPNLPVFNTAAILQALSWFRTHVPSVDQTATTYHVLHKLFAEIDRYPLVNEQLRLLNAICLWVSLHQNDCEDENVLRVLMHGATSLLAQSDLTRAAQSILEWAFTKYGEVSNREDPRFAETLIRVSCVAYDFSCSQEENLAAMGYDLLRWAESRVLKLHKYKTLKHSIYQALSAWPREIPSALQSIHNDMSHQDLSTILSDNIISSNKFRLVRRLRDLAANSQYDDTQFGGSDFWRLKECIPPSDQLSDNDLDAFCELLFLQRGSINGLGSDKPTLPLVREKHIKGIKDNASSTRSLSEDFLAPQKAIVVTLLAILNHSSLKHANLAYKTLRSLIFDSQIEPTSSAWPSRIQGELSLLQNYPRSSHPPPLHDLEALLDDPSYRDMATDFHAWITTIASLLNDMLASNIPFYVPLSFMTHSDPKFSEDVLPVLVHTILQEERSNPPNGSPIRDCISRYFSNVLMSENTALACRRSIVDIVLHLRQFSPSKSDALAYDKWLDINFLLLSENAISCGAYTTALLFLELASDYGQIADKGLSSTEKILFTIYSHIDEPDGFYGINTTDLKGFLLKRFHHEKQWEKAFQFHGAGAEIRPNDSADTEGVLLALHSYGFDNLAMSSLHDIAGSQAGQQMSFELGWRTETWDLPERSDNSDFGAPLYLALRAINRERDLGAINRTIRRVLVQVAEHFQSLGNENVTEIRQVTQNLMCLYQVKSWQSNAVDHTSQPRNIVSTGLPEMPVISENFE